MKNLIYDSQNSHSETITSQVKEKLEENPLLTAKSLCKLLNLSYSKYRDYIAHIRSKWKYDYKNRQGLNCLRFHNVRGFALLPNWVAVNRESAVLCGWILTKAKNRMLVWRDVLGRLEWFETGRINVFVRKPANVGKAVQLLANAFTKTELITDLRFWEQFRRTLRFKGAHLTYDTKTRLPYVNIDLLQESNGVKVKMGDVSHPTSLEIEFCYPDWAERNESMFCQLTQALNVALGLNGLQRKDIGVV